MIRLLFADPSVFYDPSILGMIRLFRMIRVINRKIRMGMRFNANHSNSIAATTAASVAGSGEIHLSSEQIFNERPMDVFVSKDYSLHVLNGNYTSKDPMVRIGDFRM